MNKHNDLVSNRRAFYDYEILETFETGMVLTGSEVKSLRGGNGNLQDSYVLISGTDVILRNCSIAPYAHSSSIFGHEERRERKLLLHKREIEKLAKISQDKGLTIVPLAIYLRKGFIKCKIGVAKGKKSYDKRTVIKEREAKRDIQRIMKEHNR